MPFWNILTCLCYWTEPNSCTLDLLAIPNAAHYFSKKKDEKTFSGYFIRIPFLSISAQNLIVLTMSTDSPAFNNSNTDPLVHFSSSLINSNYKEMHMSNSIKQNNSLNINNENIHQISTIDSMEEIQIDLPKNNHIESLISQDGLGMQSFSDIEEEERGFALGLKQLLDRQKVSLGSDTTDILASNFNINNDPNTLSDIQKQKNEYINMDSSPTKHLIEDELSIPAKKPRLDQTPHSEEFHSSLVQSQPTPDTNNETVPSLNDSHSNSSEVHEKQISSQNTTINDVSTGPVVINSSPDMPNELLDSNDLTNNNDTNLNMDSGKNHTVSQFSIVEKMYKHKKYVPRIWMNYHDSWQLLLGMKTNADLQSIDSDFMDIESQRALYGADIEQILVYLRSELEIPEHYRMTIEFPSLELLLNQTDSECAVLSLKKLYRYHVLINGEEESTKTDVINKKDGSVGESHDILPNESISNGEHIGIVPKENDFFFEIRASTFPSHSIAMLSELLDQSISSTSSNISNELNDVIDKVEIQYSENNGEAKLELNKSVSLITDSEVDDGEFIGTEISNSIVDEASVDLKNQDDELVLDNTSSSRVLNDHGLDKNTSNDNQLNNEEDILYSMYDMDDSGTSKNDNSVQADKVSESGGSSIENAIDVDDNDLIAFDDDDLDD
ncbi:hypothetical protein BB558_003598 [Smittium angustum]|uniref:Uncharacterized protein n=1 Tax=Smittium angustum TaxID=133377 RepID=A0A2U1J5Q8_SMIAN|nr:hypothetical protein BB558_003598 [Smittium angustum]